MTFTEALHIADSKSHLIRNHIFNGAILDEVIIAPKDKQEYEQFTKIYIQTLDAQKAILPYIQSDLIVLGVFDKYRIRKEGLLIISEI